MKKEATPANAKGLIKKTSDEKRGSPTKCKGVHQKTFCGRKGNNKAKKNLNKNERRD
jgi:hypothetical protein